MQWNMRSRLTVAFVAGILLALAGTAAWPQVGRTIRLILPFPPGGPADAMARLVAEQIGTSGGPTMVVESHPGAGTEIGAAYAKAELRSTDRLRADLRAGELSAAHRRQ